MNRTFDINGFATGSLSVSEHHLIKQAKKRLQPVIKGEYDLNDPPWAIVGTNTPNSLIRISQLHIADKAFRELICNSSLGVKVSELTGAKKVKVWGTQLYFKPPSKSGSTTVGLHRDSFHMPMFSAGAATLWLPFSSCNQSNGTIQYVRKSHTWKQKLTYEGAQYQEFEKQSLLIKQQVTPSEWEPETMSLSTGEFSLHHMHTLHGSGPNNSDAPRAALAIGLLLDDYQLDDEAPDYGFKAALDDEYVTPILYHANQSK